MKAHRCKIIMKSTLFVITAIVIIDCFTVFARAELTAVVKTASGPVQGEILTNLNSVKYASFKGIPYAKAPLGYLRFKPPVAPEPWRKTLKATVEGEDCPQMDDVKGPTGSEDCLHLNVMTPVTDLRRTPKKLKPVMVWIFGGGFQFGTPSKTYRPNYIVEKDVVYVSINYRLGPLGFLTLRHPNATGNAGLKDQVFALKWIQANIRNFGGNPNNVTIFGQSSGGEAVGFHVLSDASNGLFHGAISMSGVPLSLFVYQNPDAIKAQAEKLGTTLGATSNSSDDVLKALYKASTADIVLTASKMSGYVAAFTPTTEDECIATDAFMTECPLIKYFTGNFKKVPLMIGRTEQEALLYFNPIAPIIELLNETLGPYEVYRAEWPQKIVEAKNIINSWNNGELTNTELQTLINVTSDVLITAMIDLNQRILAANNDDKPVYLYELSYYANVSYHNILVNTTLQGAAHTDDLGYLFYYPELNYSTDPADPTRRTINRVTTMFTNFVKYGNPTPHWINDNSINVIWPSAGLAGNTLDIGSDLVVRPRVASDVVKFMQLVTWPILGKQIGCNA